MLEAIDLKKSFKDREVVRKVSISIEQGEVVGLLGPNGAGKTTCFYMIVGLIKTDSGQIKLNGNILTNLAIDKRAMYGLAYLPQDSSIFKKLLPINNSKSVNVMVSFVPIFINIEGMLVIFSELILTIILLLGISI